MASSVASLMAPMDWEAGIPATKKQPDWAEPLQRPCLSLEAYLQANARRPVLRSTPPRASRPRFEISQRAPIAVVKHDAIPTTTLIDAVIQRKRRANGGAGSMRPRKRQHLDTYHTPLWVQSAEEADTMPESSAKFRQFTKLYDEIFHSPNPTRKRRPVRVSPYKPMEVRLSPYKRSRPVRVERGISLTQPLKNPYEFLYDSGDEAEDDDAIEELADPTWEKEMEHNKENACPQEGDSISRGQEPEEIENIDFTPVRPSSSQKTKLPTPPSTDDGSSRAGDDEDMSIVDNEEDLEFRKYCRNDPDNHDEQGFKLPIFGLVSPETQAWNKTHMKEILQAAKSRGTPTKIPQIPSYVTSPPYPFPGSEGHYREKVQNSDPESGEDEENQKQSSEDELARLSPTPKVRKSSNTSVKSPPADSEKLTPSAVKKDESEEESASVKKEDAPNTTTITEKHSDRSLETPAKGLRALQISAKTPPTIRTSRTPKSSRFSTARTERVTRHQQLQVEKDAARAAGEYDLKPLSTAWDAKVKEAVRQGTVDGRYTSADFGRVVPGYSNPPGRDKWLNDAVINDYIAMVAKHGNKDDRPTQVPTNIAMSSFFFKKLTEDPTKAPPRWTARAKIPGKSLLDAERIYLPINSGAHWTLCVIEPKGKEKRTVTIYNSMGHGSNERHAAIVHMWLRSHLGNAWVEDEWTFDAAGVSPQQTNSDDCGVFTCTTARQIMLGQMLRKPYEAVVMAVQRKRMVAELINGGLIKAADS